MNGLTDTKELTSVIQENSENISIVDLSADMRIDIYQFMSTIRYLEAIMDDVKWEIDRLKVKIDKSKYTYSREEAFKENLFEQEFKLNYLERIYSELKKSIIK